LLPALVQILHLLPQTPIATHQAADIKRVNQPRSDVGPVQKFDGTCGIHCDPRLAGTLALEVCAEGLPGSNNDSKASASSTSRCSVSSRYRAQQTKNAKQENAS